MTTLKRRKSDSTDEVLSGVAPAATTTSQGSVQLVGPNAPSAKVLGVGSDAWLKANANPDMMLTGTLTRDSYGNVTSASVTWPDGIGGSFSATADATGILSWTATYAGTSGTRTVTQPMMTRDASTYAVTARPALTVS